MFDAKEMFVYVMADGVTLLGRTGIIDIDRWKESGAAVCLNDPRGLQLRPEGPNRVSVHIGPAYYGDTRQEKIYVRPTSLEVIGEIDKLEDGTEVCSQSKGLFTNYSDAVVKWKAAMSNITIAKPGDLPRG
jgi:hypothetical protein